MSRTFRALIVLGLLAPAAVLAQGLRPAVFAGQFYPADAAALAAAIDGYLAAAEAAAPAAPPAGRIVGLVAPHAGYVYAG
ncbi:MAG: AmmeMemoRadiSam system protein B, partial [Candidatus Aminicenantales bacterium]